MNNEKSPEEIAKEQEAARKAAEQAAASAAQTASEPAKAAPAVTVVVSDKPWYASNVAVTCYCVAGAAVLAAGAYFLLNAIYGDKDEAETVE